jgi:outer membrane protein assembly factor BamB
MQRQTSFVCFVLLSVGCTQPCGSCGFPIPGAEGDNAPAGKTNNGAAVRDWPMFGGTPSRNMVNLVDHNVPTEFGLKPGEKNVKWVAEIGRNGGRYVPPVIAGGQVYVATNNSKTLDPNMKGEKKAVLACFRASDGQFLWQIVHDLPDCLVAAGGATEGLMSAPVVEEDRLYYVTPGAEVICASVKEKGKIIWRLDMVKDLKVVLNAACFGSPLVADDLLFVVTGNGKDYEGPDKPVPQPQAPSFVAINKKTGAVVWKDNSPGEAILDGQWASPSYAEVNGAGMVLFPGGDGWLRGFAAQTGKLLWSFDANPKDSVYNAGGRGTRSYLVAPPVIHDNKAYFGVGQQPEHGAGVGHLWCIDITKTGDISAELKVDGKVMPNKNSGVVWHYGGPTKGGLRDFDFGRTVSTCAVHDGLVYAAELDGFLHCLDAKTGQKHWDYDLKSQTWASPYYVDGKVYLGNEEGDLTIMAAGKEKKQLAKIEIGPGIKAPVVVADGVLYVQKDSTLWAIKSK